MEGIHEFVVCLADVVSAAMIPLVKYRQAERALQHFNGRKRPYFDRRFPPERQRHFKVFTKWLQLCRAFRLKPEEYIALLGYNHIAFPELLISGEAIKEIKKRLEFRKHLKEKKPQEIWAKDRELIRDIVGRTGRNPLEVINLVWNLLSERGKKRLSKFRSPRLFGGFL